MFPATLDRCRCRWQRCFFRRFLSGILLNRSIKSAALVLLLVPVLAPLMARADSVVVFNEIMYHPATNESALEWLELYNQNAVDVDMSGWRLAGAIHYDFPNGAVIRAGRYLVVTISPATLSAQTGLTNL